VKIELATRKLPKTHTASRTSDTHVSNSLALRVLELPNPSASWKIKAKGETMNNEALEVHSITQ
jgi:hypothetical protein